MSQNFIAVIPAFNEEKTIAGVLEKTSRYVDTIIVVDDCSTDSTPEILQGYKVKTLRNPHNLGKGAALHRGFQEALTLGATHVITLDGDGQHDGDELPGLLEAARRYPSNVVIGARLKERHNAPKNRYIANRIADFWISWAAGEPVVDSQSGFRIYPAELVKQVEIPHQKANSFVYESEILISAIQCGFLPVAVPITTHYPEERRESYFRPGADIFNISKMVSKKLLAKGFNPAGIWRFFTKSPRRLD
ncbi:MAG: hypothetical protein CMF50_09270 [Legionellales bacterium]|nr:hypothetical protein [Legionellales bacterium]|tara:strand:- start:14320 stop:15063 length:744 start_codon:yes stop_codon:yes gene_type:complete